MLAFSGEYHEFLFHVVIALPAEAVKCIRHSRQTNLRSLQYNAN